MPDSPAAPWTACHGVRSQPVPVSRAFVLRLGKVPSAKAPAIARYITVNWHRGRTKPSPAQSTACLVMVRDRGELTAARVLLGPERGVSEGLGKEGDVCPTFARGARGETNLPWLEAHDRVGPGFLVQQPCATDAVPW